MYYPGDRKGVQYFGPTHAPALQQFLHNCQNPLSVLHSASDAVDLRASSPGGGVVVGYFPDLFSSLGEREGARLNLNYRRFLHASYLLLESDPFRREVGQIAAVTSRKVAFQLQLNQVPTFTVKALPAKLTCFFFSIVTNVVLFQNQPVRYFHWQVGTSTTPSVCYPNKTITSSSALVQWLYTARPTKNPTLTAWIGALGRKSLFLSGHLLSGSGRSLIVFTRRGTAPAAAAAAARHEAPAAAAAREAALRYHDCDGRGRSEEVARRIGDLCRSTDLELEVMLRTCAEDAWVVRHFCGGRRRGEEKCLCRCARGDNGTVSSGGAFAGFGDSFRTARSTPGLLLKRERRVFGSFDGPLSDVRVHNALVRRLRLDCASAASHPRSCAILFAEEMAASVNALADQREQEEEEGDEWNATGLGCADNRTLNFYLSDLGSQRAFASQLGLSRDEVEEEAAVIVDLPGESVYVMEESVITPRSLSRFAARFHRDALSLKRLRLTSNTRQGGVEEAGKSVLRSLSAIDFESRVLNSTSGVMLLYTSRSCGACASVAHAFHAVGRLLSASDGLQLYTVDAGANDLPWHFSALTVPSVIFFPAGGPDEKADSRHEK